MLVDNSVEVQRLNKTHLLLANMAKWIPAAKPIFFALTVATEPLSATLI
jgi:hypothetical protein